ncbi:MAG: hypothetical protein KJS98_14015 [Nitrospirae bacterium]|nr:hypothetical protein [Nitrospirota bacterium]
MKRVSQHTMSRALVIVAGLAVLHVTAVATVLAEEQKEGDVGTRAVLGAPPQQGQLPTFPQNFAVQGPESASFGFAVTQPGPITVDVQAQGPPVIVTLQNLAAPPMTQQGSGHVHLAYQATPQDIQKSAIWTVRIKLAQPAPPLANMHAIGTVIVQHPPADPGVVQGQVTAMTTQDRANRQRANDQAQASLDAAFQAHRAKFEQERQQRQAAERAQNQPIIEQIRAKGGNVIQSRGLESGGKPGGPSSSSADQEVGTRGLFGTVGVGTPLPGGSLTQPTNPPTFSSPPARPSPVIDHLSKTQGQPKDQVVIYGKNFGNAGGDVVFQIGSNVRQTGLVEAWADTLIVVDVPDASGLLQFDGGVFIPMGQIQSNTVPFRFIPAQEVRMTRTAKGDVMLAQPGSDDTNPVSGWDSITHPNTTTWRMGGHAGNDVVFPTKRLQNGWIFQNVSVLLPGCGLFPDCQGAYVADSRIGTDTLMFNARWWYEALHDSDYNFAVWIVGPRGVPDGLVVP